MILWVSALVYRDLKTTCLSGLGGTVGLSLKWWHDIKHPEFVSNVVCAYRPISIMIMITSAPPIHVLRSGFCTALWCVRAPSSTTCDSCRGCNRYVSPSYNHWVFVGYLPDIDCCRETLHKHHIIQEWIDFTSMIEGLYGQDCVSCYNHEHRAVCRLVEWSAWLTVAHPLSIKQGH